MFEGERYVALGYKYRLIDQEYKLSILNEVLVNVDYQQNGSSATMWKQYVKILKGLHFGVRFLCNTQNRKKDYW